MVIRKWCVVGLDVVAVFAVSFGVEAARIRYAAFPCFVEPVDDVLRRFYRDNEISVILFDGAEFLQVLQEAEERFPRLVAIHDGGGLA